VRSSRMSRASGSDRASGRASSRRACRPRDTRRALDASRAGRDWRQSIRDPRKRGPRLPPGRPSHLVARSGPVGQSRHGRSRSAARTCVPPPRNVARPQ
jgi:hypothetical protein